MEPMVKHEGLVACMNRVNVDTDQIIPKQFLKRIERDGFGEFLFFDWRYLPDGSPNPEFELNRPEAQGATILLVDDNFGCGSSREHAVWALRDYGFRVILAPSFADIFYNNCFKNGLLPIRIPRELYKQLSEAHARGEWRRMTVDLEQQTAATEHGVNLSFEIDPHKRHMLLHGLDDIGITLQYEAEIAAYETSRRPYQLVYA
ncbi:3-isopropylmalate dehydratase small subunit [Alicyclobacillus mali]|uniref:3-isopropylmalate dehydratase small subunit n=1 Tax=Alicyclobacillus mali (ex Roth et al. 2021) TaxID=1123961 RepID=A0ABS0F6R9_9BACL|nr:3-isopropylmalate dehydratase small subunit [Alicyclobacillus mali (ex Roth et al. 2021)]MBF8378968.1 3-isopropylmalate dehydratase small subunit [Alicyclobacillus mali (ex Roth et al. 2021)]